MVPQLNVRARTPQQMMMTRRRSTWALGPWRHISNDSNWLGIRRSKTIETGRHEQRYRQAAKYQMGGTNFFISNTIPNSTNLRIMIEICYAEWGNFESESMEKQPRWTITIGLESRKIITRCSLIIEWKTICKLKFSITSTLHFKLPYHLLLDKTKINH